VDISTLMDTHLKIIKCAYCLQNEQMFIIQKQIHVSPSLNVPCHLRLSCRSNAIYRWRHQWRQEGRSHSHTHTHTVRWVHCWMEMLSYWVWDAETNASSGWQHDQSDVNVKTTAAEADPATVFIYYIYFYCFIDNLLFCNSLKCFGNDLKVKQ